jgi:D-alanyl-lipoteichoic acid acyltransferase DltB (MBOAT superfamily)
MLFNSYPFLLAFLPVVWLGAVFLNRWAPRNLYLVWLVLASLAFYGWNEPWLLTLIVGSMAFNFAVGRRLTAPVSESRAAQALLGRRAMLALGIAGNLALIGYFKYAGFAMQNLALLWPGEWSLPQIALPLGISFYTFQQIAYLVDAYRGEVRRHDLAGYSLFVSFFPQLVAGPIVHHRDLLDQFARKQRFALNSANLSIGLTIFTIGLAKKVLLADACAPFATAVFNAAEQGRAFSLAEAWGAACLYALQLYFDFSGYSDMAIGLSRMFAIRLPLNFDSPYKATGIIDFWRRWHMTLSQFLRDYLYVPLGGNRHGPARRYANLLITMLLGGLWHGAGWTFVLWGGLHGIMLIVNHVWRGALKSAGMTMPDSLAVRTASRLATFLCVVLAWVLFRAATLAGAGRMYAGLCGLHSASWLGSETWHAARLDPVHAAIWIALGLAIVWGLPNTQELMGRVRPALGYWRRPLEAQLWSERLLGWMQWRPHPVVAVWYAGLFVTAFSALAELSEFIYFHF